MRHLVINTIIFDFGGVLIEWDPRLLYRRYFKSSAEMEAFLSEINFADWNSHQDRGRSFAEGVRLLSSQFPHREPMIRLYHEHWIESIGKPIAGSIAILKKARSLGYRVYGLSNWSQETFPLIRDQYDFFDLLDGYLISGEAQAVKPDPQIFHLLLARIRRTAGECLFIDDSQANLETARQLGFSCIHFTTPEQLESQLLDMGIFTGRL